MIVSYHDPKLNNEPFIDGANLYSMENSKLIKEFGDCFTAQPHNIRNVVSRRTNLSKLRSDDVIVSNAGPYAFAYHYLREKKGLKFRIIRDVQTSFKQGCFLQEKLCEPYTKEGDVVLFLSEFQRQLFIKLFPESLNTDNTFVCAPFMHFFPKELPQKENNYDGLTLGWVGRVTPEKGFHKALEAFVKIRKHLDNVRMIVSGGMDSQYFKKWVSHILKKNKISPEEFIRLNNGRFMPHDSIWGIYKQFDIFLFPSISSNESLGRVMIEATYCRLPVIAANYAATPEILNKSYLLPVTYKKGLLQIASIDTIGQVEPKDIIKKVIEYQKIPKGNISFYKNHDLKYINILKGVQKKENCKCLSKDIKNLIENVRFYQDKCLSKQKSFEILRQFLVNESYACLSLWNGYIPAYMGYNPYMLIFENKKRKIFGKIHTSTQKFIMHAKTPIRTYLKRYYLFKRKRVLKSLMKRVA